MSFQFFVEEGGIDALRSHEAAGKGCAAIWIEDDELSDTTLLDWHWVEFKKSPRFGGVAFHDHVPGQRTL